MSVLSSSIATINDVGGGTLLTVLLVSGNYLGELLPCEIRQQLEESRMAKYTILLFIIWYFISGAGVDASRQTILSLVGAFTLVLILTKTHWPIFIAILALLFVGDVLKKTGFLEASTICNVLGVVVLLVGFVRYVKEKRSEYTNSHIGFVWNKFWFENHCANGNVGSPTVQTVPLLPILAAGIN